MKVNLKQERVFRIDHGAYSSPGWRESGQLGPVIELTRDKQKLYVVCDKNQYADGVAQAFDLSRSMTIIAAPPDVIAELQGGFNPT